MMTFKDLNLNTPLLNALEDLGLTHPTTIQQRAFSPIMAGKDVLGIAQTGTGKTFAYLLPLLRQWKFVKKKNAEIIVLVPTRELVVQVVEEIEKLTKYTNIVTTGVYGGTNIKTQMHVIAQGVDIIVATPGRLVDLLLNKSIAAKLIKKVVIDEVDEMMNLGFRTQLKTIIDLLPQKKQMLMFSATIPDEVQELIDYSFNSAEKIEAAPAGTPLENIEQIAYFVPNYTTKINFLEQLLSEDKRMTKVLVFAASKRLADDIHARIEAKFEDELAVIHSNKAQNKRFKTIEEFEEGKSRILIATDLIARGIDVSSVSHVINMDMPSVTENYIHRIGRTGRADKKGISITFVSDRDKEALAKVEALMGRKLELQQMPDDIEISDILTPDEMPQVHMKIIEVKQPKIERGASHHEKLPKNKKVNIKVSREDAKKKKYGKRYRREHRG